MSKRACWVSAQTKHEFVRTVAKKCGYPIYQCSEVWDACVETMAEILADGRAVVFKKLGRLEPYQKKERKMYYLSNEEKGGIKLNENGERESYTFPAVNWIKFHIANHMKFKLNPGIYNDDDTDTEFDD